MSQNALNNKLNNAIILIIAPGNTPVFIIVIFVQLIIKSAKFVLGVISLMIKINVCKIFNATRQVVALYVLLYTI